MTPRTLGEHQELFMQLLPRLLDKAHELGFKVRGGELWRSDAAAAEYARQGKGIQNSLHRDKLAIDLNLFKDGKYLTASEDHKPLGDFWKSLHPLCCWGGDFRPSPDGNHYSITWQGRK
jgi:hypothetical protein